MNSSSSIRANALHIYVPLRDTADSKPDTCIWQYTDLLKTKRIEIWFSEKDGLIGNVYALTSNGDFQNVLKGLPLIGMNPSLLKEKHIDKLLDYFVCSHFIPEKGMDGVVNRIAVHVSGQGGVKAAIPFQPGLAMGTIVRGDIIEKMEEYAQVMAKIEAFEEQIRGAEQKISIYETKIKSRASEKNLPSIDLNTKDDSNLKDPLIKFWVSEIKRINELITTISTSMSDSGKIPLFEGFQQGIITPIDRGASPVEIQPLGFDSLTFNSEYIQSSEENSEIHNRLSQSASSSSFSASGGWGIWNAGVSRSRAEAVAQRVADIKKEKIVEGILVINATATTRHVRCFKEIKWDLNKLRQIYNVMDKGTEKELDRFGITSPDAQDKANGEPAIYLLTEAVLGGSFTALVTFLDTNKMSRHIHDKQSQESQSSSYSVGGGFWFIRARADYANASSSASKEEDDVLRSIAQTRVRIEFICQGALPTFERHTIEREVFKHLNLDPSKFELSQQDAAEAEQIVKATGQDKQIALVKSAMKLQNSQIAFLNTYRGLSSGQEKANLHTMESVMGAYENFAEQMTQDKECGVPVGFYYQVLPKSEIKRILVENGQIIDEESSQQDDKSTKSTAKDKGKG